MKEIWTLLKSAFTDWRDDKAPRLAAALAYYTIFSLAPLLIIAIGVAGIVFGEAAARNEIVGQLEGVIGPEAAEIVQTMLANAGQQGRGVIATIVGFVTLIVGATGLFAQLQDALNTVWEVERKPGQGLWTVVRQRGLSFLMVLGVGLLLLLSLLASAALSPLRRFLEDALPGLGPLWRIIDIVVSFLVITLLFAAIFKVLPDVKIRWRDVWLGAAVTAVLFVIGEYLIGLYLGFSSTASVFGAAGSLVLLLLWIYYSAQILLFGAEFTQVYARRRGEAIEPAPYAQSLSDESRARQGMRPRTRQPTPRAGMPVRAATAAGPAVEVPPQHRGMPPVSRLEPAPFPAVQTSWAWNLAVLLFVLLGTALPTWQTLRKLSKPRPTE